MLKINLIFPDILFQTYLHLCQPSFDMKYNGGAVKSHNPGATITYNVTMAT